MGHRCYVESGAGQGSGFDDERYRQRRRADRLLHRGGLRARRDDPVGLAAHCQPSSTCCTRARSSSASCTWPSRTRARLELLLERKVTAIAYETIQDRRRAPAGACGRQPDRRAHGRQRGGPTAAEQRGRAWHPVGRCAGCPAGQGRHPRRRNRRHERGQDVPRHGRRRLRSSTPTCASCRAWRSRAGAPRRWWPTTSTSPAPCKLADVLVGAVLIPARARRTS